MIIESKIIAVILFVLGTFFLLCGLMVLSGVRKIDKEDRVLFIVMEDGFQRRYDNSYRQTVWNVEFRSIGTSTYHV